MFFFILRKPKQHSRENRPTATHSVSYRTTAYSQARAYHQTHSTSCQVRLLFFFIVFFFRFLLMVAKYLRVDALLEFNCHEMTLWDKLGGSIVWSISARRDCKIIISGINYWYSIVVEIKFLFFLEIFCRVTKNKKLLPWRAPRSIVEYCRGSSVRCSKPTKLVWLTFPMTVWIDQWPSHAIEACGRVSTRQARAGNIAYKCAN